MCYYLKKIASTRGILPALGAPPIDPCKFPEAGGSAPRPTQPYPTYSRNPRNLSWSRLPAYTCVN